MKFIRDEPFNLKRGGGGGGGYGFFYKNILIPNVAEQNIVILVEDNKKKSDSELLSYNLMLNSGKKINILTLVLSEKKI